MNLQRFRFGVVALLMLFGATLHAQTVPVDSNNTTNGADTNSTDTAGTTDGLSPTTAFTQLSNEGVGPSADSVRSQNTTSVGGAANGGATGGLGGGGLGGLGGLLGGLGASGFGQGLGGSTTTKPALRTRLRSSIDVAPMPAQQVQRSAQSRFYQTPTTSRFRSVQVNMVEGTAVINGVVTSEKDRRMSELLMRLEPGVRRVNNQVIVSP